MCARISSKKCPTPGPEALIRKVGEMRYTKRLYNRADPGHFVWGLMGIVRIPGIGRGRNVAAEAMPRWGIQFPFPPAGSTEISAALVQPLFQTARNDVKWK